MLSKFRSGRIDVGLPPITNSVDIDGKGSRGLGQGFFDQYPVFYDTSETSAQPWRLNLRHEAIFESHSSIFKGARVLDIASHDGRWSFAAHKAGARHVTGIEARQELVELSTSNLRSYGVADEEFEFIQGDVFDVLKEKNFDVDIVLCLGFLYHTLRYNELMAGIRKCDPVDLIIDSLVKGDPDVPSIYLASEPANRQGNAVEDAFTLGDQVLIGRPSVAAVNLIAAAHGFSLQRFSDWGALIRDNPSANGVRDYREGRRVTAHYQRSVVDISNK